MFSTPAFRSLNQLSNENSNNLMAKKPGQQVSARKPFSDRTVNQPVETTSKKVTPKPKLLKTENLDDSYKLIVDGSSYKDESLDFGPFLSKQQILNILTSYTGKRERTPSPKKDVKFKVDGTFTYYPDDYDSDNLPEIDLMDLYDENTREIDLVELGCPEIDDVDLNDSLDLDSLCIDDL